MTVRPHPSTPPPSPLPSPSPEPIMRIASGFMAAKHLFAANELGLFEALAESPAALDALAARTGLTPRATRISADAMVALGLLHRDGDQYRNGPEAAVFLSGATPADLRPFLRFWDRISYPAWTGLAEALGSGPRPEVMDLDDAQQEIMSAGIEAILAGPASALPHAFDFSRSSRLLDVGGGTGSWSISVASDHPHLRATVLELAPVADIARRRVASVALDDRIDVVAGDVFGEALPTGYDTFLVANVVHYWSPEENADVLARLRAAAAPDAHVLLADFWTDATHTEPVHAALMAGEFAVQIPHGDVYSVDEARRWLDATGWRFVDHIPLAGPQSLVVAAAA